MKSTIQRVSDRLPNSIKKTAREFQALLLGIFDSFRTISLTADKAHLVDVGISGEYGVIQGSPHDLIILREYSRTGKWAEKTNGLIIDFFRTAGSGTYLDIGANIGLTTIPLCLSQNIKCHCFEPSPTNYRYLRTNTLNTCPDADISLHNIALFDSESVLSFELSPKNFGDHRIKLNEGPNTFNEDTWKTIEVPAQRLDDLALEITGPLVAKIDTQGAEPYVLTGGEKTLAQADLILIEFGPYWLNRLGGDLQVILNFITTFKEVTIIRGDISEDSTLLSGENAAQIMEQLYQDCYQETTPRYWDIIARRNVSK